MRSWARAMSRPRFWWCDEAPGFGQVDFDDDILAAVLGAKRFTRWTEGLTEVIVAKRCEHGTILPRAFYETHEVALAAGRCSPTPDVLPKFGFDLNAAIDWVREQPHELFCSQAWEGEPS